MKFTNTVKRHLLGAVVITGLGFAGVYQQRLLAQQVLSPQLMADIVTEVEANPLTVVAPRNPLTDYNAEEIIEALNQ